MTGHREIVSTAWKESGQRGRCWCRTVRGAHGQVVVVHHGHGLDATDVEPERAHRFVETCRKRLRRARLKPDGFLFMLEDPHTLRRRYPFSRSDLERILKKAYVVVDRLPKGQWKRLPTEGWIGVYYNGDRIEMWERRVERRGALYRVVEGGWTSTQMSASHFEEVTYVGAERGAMLYAGY